MVVVKSFISESMKSDLLEALGKCRQSSIEFSSKAPINGPEYIATDALRRALDDMTGILTGDREHFWAKTHPRRDYHKNCGEAPT